MRWTADNDHLLLVTLLETHSVSVKGELIRQAWPQDGREIPTARAITERIVKIRQIAQEKIKNSDGQPQTPSTPKTTPGRKRKANDQPTDKYITNVTSVGSVETPSKKSKAPCKGSPMKKPESRPNTPSSLPHEDKMAGSCMIIKQELKYFGSSSPEEY